MPGLNADGSSPAKPSFSLRQMEIAGTALFLLMAVWLGYYQRMIPVYNNPFGEFRYDAIFNYRMCLELVQHGKIPDVDPLSLYPIGKKLHEEIPLLVYYGFAFFNFLSKTFLGLTDLKSNVLRYNAVCGALMAIPIYWSVLSLTKKKWVAFICSLLPAITPYYHQRTLANHFRYEVLGIFLLYGCLAFFIRSLESESRRRAIFRAGLGGAFLLAAFASWRVSLLFFMLLTVTCLLLFLLQKKSRRVFLSYSMLFVAFVVASFLVGYMKAHTYLLTQQSLFAFAVLGIMACALFLGRKGPEHEPSLKIKIVVTTVGLALWAILPIASHADPYRSLSASLTRIVLYRIGLIPHLGPEDILYHSGGELLPTGITELWSLDSFSSSFLILLTYGVLLFRKKIETLRRPSHFAVFFLLFVFLALSFVIRRNITLFLPAAFIVMGIGIDFFVTDLSNRFKQKNPQEWRIRSFFWGTILGLILAHTLINSNQQLLHMKGSHVNYEPPLTQAFQVLKKNTKPGDVIGAHWQYGYPIQAICDRPTLTDGLFEIPEMRRRVLEDSAVWAGENEEDLWNHFKKYGVRYVMITYETLVAPLDYQRLRPQNYLRPDGAPTEAGMKINVLRMYFQPESTQRFKLVYTNPEIRIFEVLPTTPPLSISPGTTWMQPAELDSRIRVDGQGRRTISRKDLELLVGGF